MDIVIDIKLQYEDYEKIFDITFEKEKTVEIKLQGDKNTWEKN